MMAREFFHQHQLMFTSTWTTCESTNANYKLNFKFLVGIVQKLQAWDSQTYRFSHLTRWVPFFNNFGTEPQKILIKINKNNAINEHITKPKYKIYDIIFKIKFQSCSPWYFSFNVIDDAAEAFAASCQPRILSTFRFQDLLIFIRTGGILFQAFPLLLEINCTLSGLASLEQEENLREKN